MKHLMNSRFKDVQGGLFVSVAKADVGGGVMKLVEQGYDLMAWADPFYPDPILPKSVKEGLLQAIEKEEIMHYSQPIGQTVLRNKLASAINKKTGLNLQGERNIIITPGSDSGLLYAMMPFIEYGDEVMVVSPSYASNFVNTDLLGGKCVNVPIFEEDGYQLRISEFERRVTSKTKMVVITHPNNPTTTVFNRASLEGLRDFIVKHDLVLVSDQAFEDHIYTKECISPASLDGLFERTLTVCSFSKGYGMSGFRVGYIYACDTIMDVLYGAAVNVLGATGTVNHLAANIVMDDTTYLPWVKEKFIKRIEKVTELFSTLKCVSLTPIESGFLAWINISKLGTSAEVVKRIQDDAHVLVNSGAQYGSEGEGYIRVVIGCFMDDARAIDALARMKNVFIEMAKEKNIEA